MPGDPVQQVRSRVVHIAHNPLPLPAGGGGGAGPQLGARTIPRRRHLQWFKQFPAGELGERLARHSLHHLAQHDVIHIGVDKPAPARGLQPQGADPPQ